MPCPIPSQILRRGVYPERSRRAPQNDRNAHLVRDSNSNRNWLVAKEGLAPDILGEIQSGGSPSNPSIYQEIGISLREQPELQRQVLEKTKREDLTIHRVREVVKAVKQAPTPVELQSILNRPVARTSEELTRDARVETLLKQPTRELTRVDSLLSPGGRGLG
jgi:hypothetical protein